MAYAVLQPLAGLLKGPDMKKEGFLLRTVTRATVILLLGEYLIDLRIGSNMYREHSCPASVETLSPFQGGACCTGWPRLLVHPLSVSAGLLMSRSRSLPSLSNIVSAEERTAFGEQFTNIS